MPTNFPVHLSTGKRTMFVFFIDGSRLSIAFNNASQEVCTVDEDFTITKVTFSVGLPYDIYHKIDKNYIPIEAGDNISITSSTDSLIISATGGGSSYTFTDGLTENGGTVSYSYNAAIQSPTSTSGTKTWSGGVALGAGAITGVNNGVIHVGENNLILASNKLITTPGTGTFDGQANNVSIHDPNIYLLGTNGGTGLPILDTSNHANNIIAAQRSNTLGSFQTSNLDHSIINMGLSGGKTLFCKGSYNLGAFTADSDAVSGATLGLHGNYNISVGSNSYVKGNYSRVQGYKAKVVSNFAVSEGIGTEATSDYQHV